MFCTVPKEPKKTNFDVNYFILLNNNNANLEKKKRCFKINFENWSFFWSETFKTCKTIILKKLPKA